jgi:hypothetical protein
MASVETEQLGGGPAIGFSTFQCLNAFSLLMLLPQSFVPGWIFAITPLLAGAGAFVIVSRIYCAQPIQVRYAKLSDNVPGLREFPLVYAYLFGTFALFATCLYVAVHRAA